MECKLDLLLSKDLQFQESLKSRQSTENILTWGCALIKEHWLRRFCLDILMHRQVETESFVVLCLPSESRCFTMSSRLLMLSLFFLCSTLPPNPWHTSMLFCYSVNISSSTHDAWVLNRHWSEVQVACHLGLLYILEILPWPALFTSWDNPVELWFVHIFPSG